MTDDRAQGSAEATTQVVPLGAPPRGRDDQDTAPLTLPPAETAEARAQPAPSGSRRVTDPASDGNGQAPVRAATAPAAGSEVPVADGEVPAAGSEVSAPSPGPAGTRLPPVRSNTGARTARPEGRAPRGAARRRARLALRRVEPVSVFVLALLISIFVALVLLVAVGVLYTLLDNLGVVPAVNNFARELEVVQPGQSILSLPRVLGVAGVIAAVDVVLLTVLATLGAFLYNVCASLTGGVEVVLAERE